jgi:hypothetical protein
VAAGPGWWAGLDREIDPIHHRMLAKAADRLAHLKLCRSGNVG